MEILNKELLKMKVMIDTGVIGHYSSKLNYKDDIMLGRQLLTREFWKRTSSLYVPYISDIIFEEISNGNVYEADKRIKNTAKFNIISTTTEMELLADMFIINKILREEDRNDALIISAAIVSKMDVLVTWNFKHINNKQKKHQMRKLLQNYRYKYVNIMKPNICLYGMEE